MTRGSFADSALFLMVKSQPSTPKLNENLGYKVGMDTLRR